MAFIQISVSGTPTYGGELSVDRRGKVAISDGQVYSVQPGLHLIEISSGSQVWKINAQLEANSVIELEILSKGRTVITEPAYTISELTDEGVEAGNSFVEKTYKGTIFDTSVPKRSKAKIVTGIILMLIGVGCDIDHLVKVASNTLPFAFTTILAGILCFGIGLLFFALGYKKKIR